VLAIVLAVRAAYTLVMLIGCLNGFPVSTLHKTIVLSRLPEASTFPSGLKARLVIPSV
jgi:hypothetical protein